MSIIFGMKKPNDVAIEDSEFVDLAHATGRYAADGTSWKIDGSVGMGFQPYNTHQRSNLELQPALDTRNNMVTFDGRLDNYQELCNLLNIQDTTLPDSRIVLSAFELWGEEAFSRLVGDWALALWVNTERSIYLARDHAGTRSLYFERSDECVLWGTFLETFFTGQRTREFDKAFAASYLACQPIRELTPYKGIRAIPPAHYLKFHKGELTQKAHWRWMVKSRINYRKDADYEKHFLTLFQQSVERRTGPGAPILAQLSGGMDSTSIVCLSDHLRRERGAAPADLLTTISYYDDSEPNWNERPYFTAVEASRGKAGFHIDVSTFERSWQPANPAKGRYLLPGGDASTLSRESDFVNLVSCGGFRCILSGVGGDEVLGGVPNPLPELGNYLVTLRLSLLLRTSMHWCLATRTPIAHMLGRTALFVANLYRWKSGLATAGLSWIKPQLYHALRERARRDIAREGLLSGTPATISNGLSWWAALDTLPTLYPSLLHRYVYLYPYLDRDLVEFLSSIPQEQLLRPGQRRSLMRRSLREIVPALILERRRKAFVIRRTVSSLRMSADGVKRLFSGSRLEDCGCVDGEQLRLRMNSMIDDRAPEERAQLLRAIALELWLRAQPPVR
jgi:asparagine synthase (glutamine-hydrolysing)